MNLFSLLLALGPMFLYSPTDTQPQLVKRAAVPYAAIRTRVTLQNFSEKAPPLWPEVKKWLDAKGVKTAGPPLVRYLVIDMAKEMEIEIGFPIAKAVKGDRRVVTGTLPAGRYVQVIHKGDYSGMVAANGALQDWAVKQGLVWKMSGKRWDGRIELYPVDPGDTPDSTLWESEILYLVK